MPQRCYSVDRCFSNSDTGTAATGCHCSSDETVATAVLTMDDTAWIRLKATGDITVTGEKLGSGSLVQLVCHRKVTVRKTSWSPFTTREPATKDTIPDQSLATVQVD